MTFLPLPQAAAVLEQLLVTSAMIGDIASDPTSSHPATSQLAEYQSRHEDLIAELQSITRRVDDPNVLDASARLGEAASTIATRGQGSVMRSSALQTYFEAGAFILRNASPVT